ncbi:MAG: hypothetical protein WD851_23865 [Pirellulales bacterium]
MRSFRDFFSKLMLTLTAFFAIAAAPRHISAQTPAPHTHSIAGGDLHVLFRDNSESPRVLSGLDSMFNTRSAPGFDAYDPDEAGASAGLNFEHIISGHKHENNAFTPRHGPFALTVLPDGRSVRLTRRSEDDSWNMSSTLTYTVTAPHYVDVDFRCTPHDARLFGDRGYAILFFANYMNDVEQLALNFRGIEGPQQPEKWIAADAPTGHPDWNQGGTYRSVEADDLPYDADHNFKLNSWSYDYPRFTQPFYYGRAAHGMVFMLMFDRILTNDDEIRFSLFKFKIPRAPRPAWDFQYVLRRIEAGRVYGFKARLVWKKFVSAEDCLREYEAWSD